MTVSWGHPLDVICGAALGLAIASCINLLLGVPAGERELNSS
jgi:hypothetical protein